MNEPTRIGKKSRFVPCCLGCAAIVVLPVAAIVVMTGIVFTVEDEKSMLDIEREYTLPAGPGVISLDLSLVRLEIDPSDPEGPLRIDGRYDQAAFELDQSFETTGDSWTLVLRFNRKLSWFQLYSDDNENHLRLSIPLDAPVALRGDTGIGDVRLDLGGMSLTDVELDLGLGNHDVWFGTALREPLDRLALNASLGVLDVQGIGHASPRHLSIGHMLGETILDLGGAWRRDADVRLGCGMGECSIRLPLSLNIDLSGGHIRRPTALPGPEQEAPWLRGEIRGALADVKILWGASSPAGSR